MSTDRLEKELNKALDDFRENTLFNLETFEQVHENEYLTKDDLEEINRQVFYCLHDFKSKIVKYLKENNR
ncbi:uncharacterized protein KNN_05959 [Bacillus thuringiensis serovar tolworthi]|uniref:Uncharacterized protein n=1 Tax=Bacillus thuringiensis subsp. tolworthi TaxID=1442 RepID=A0A9W3ZZV6_BACTO|nr:MULTISPECIES: hypothetical protein [Bacillus cereus group]MEB9590202.1 hypothetical protein [Bacillus cereus]PEY30458.1 hypothetical protein CN354_24870 [Bacillus cereus]BAR86751.1 uncharacterized protein KNN_05959 [Bacillus thuringiensis serovar tolworthi]